VGAARQAATPRDGETSPRPCGGAMVIKIDLDRLAKLVKKHPDATIKELHARLGANALSRQWAWRSNDSASL
jgi:hypothetical protein